MRSSKISRVRVEEVFTRNEIYPVVLTDRNGLHGSKWGSSHLNSFIRLSGLMGCRPICTEIIFSINTK